MKRLLFAIALLGISSDTLALTVKFHDGTSKDNCTLTQADTTYTLSCTDGTTYHNLKRCTPSDPTHPPLASYQPAQDGIGPHVPMSYHLYPASTITQLAPGTCSRAEL